MRSDAYWAMRAAQQEDISDRKARETVRQVQAIYDKAISDIEADIKEIFRKYAKDGRLSLEEAKKLLSTKETAAALEELRGQLAGIKDKAARRKLLNRINAPAYAARISRLEALLDKIDAAFYRIAEIQLQAGRQRFIEAANDAFLRTIWNIQTDTGLGFSFTLLPQRAIEKALEHTWDGKNYSDRVWQSTGAAAAYAKKIVTAGLASGKSARRMARELDELTQAGEYNCMRLIRTENNYFHNLGALQGYKEAGLTKYRYLATLDSRTCKVCGALDNKIFPIKDAVAGKNYPPIHPNDRCTTAGVIQRQDRSRMKRSARDPATGKTVYVPADMSYTAWRESLSENQDGALQYSQKPLEAAQSAGYNRGAGNASTIEENKYRGINHHEDGTIVVTDDWTNKKRPHLKAVYKPHAVVDTVSRGGKQRDRTIYDAEGRQKVQISNGPHANSKQHPYGNHGEHAHDIVWENGEIVSRNPRELTEQERKEHADIL